MVKPSSVINQISPGADAASLALPNNGGHQAKSSSAGLSLKHLALAQDFDEAIGLETQVHVVPVKKPSKQSFVRVHPSAEFRVAMALLRDDTGEMYAVTSKMLGLLADEAKPMMVYTATDEAGNVFLWPVGLPGIDGRTNAWWQSAHAAAALATKEWVRVVSATEAGFYKTKTSKVDKGEPKWPEMTFEQLVLTAFGDGRLIDSQDHPVVRRLNGEA